IKLFSIGSLSEVSNYTINAIKKGNSSAIAQNMSEKINLKVLNKDGIYSKSQAESILKDFFSKNKIKNFNTTHSNSQKNGNEFFSGILNTEAGNFKISFQIKYNDNKYLISHFQIEHEKN
ncbi:MAG: DUF4783 domain-containing protein, partial [Bacteroidota bacterium]